jgi:hypothetical protein
MGIENPLNCEQLVYYTARMVAMQALFLLFFYFFNINANQGPKREAKWAFKGAEAPSPDCIPAARTRC